MNQNSGYGEITIECEEGHIWTHKPEGGGYFRLRVLMAILKNVLDPSNICDECGRPFYKVSLRRHTNGSEGRHSNGHEA